MSLDLTVATFSHTEGTEHVDAMVAAPEPGSA